MTLIALWNAKLGSAQSGDGPMVLHGRIRQMQSVARIPLVYLGSRVVRRRPPRDVEETGGRLEESRDDVRIHAGGQVTPRTWSTQSHSHGPLRGSRDRGSGTT
jgi:hypothetical protein